MRRLLASFPPSLLPPVPCCVLYLVVQAEEVVVILPHLGLCFRHDLADVPVERQVKRYDKPLMLGGIRGGGGEEVDFIM